MKMQIVDKFGYEELAVLYVAKNTDTGSYLEFVESLQPPYPREEKWVLIISTMYGCPVQCFMCDAGTYFKGLVSAEDLFRQIDFLISNRYSSGKIPVQKFKVQFARIGEPALNPHVLDVLKELPNRYDAPGLMPCISTIAPRKGTNFMEELLKIKRELYSKGNFQLQFSIHSSDEKMREKIIPYPKWNLQEIAQYGERFFEIPDRKVTLNFAVEKNNILDVKKIAKIFDQEKFFIKLTPINPTEIVKQRNLESLITPENKELAKKLVNSFEEEGFDTLLSIGELEENKIGSNCGQQAIKYEDGKFITLEYMPFQENT